MRTADPSLSARDTQVKQDFGKIDIMVHSLANGPEVTKPLLETSRNVRTPVHSSTAHSCMHDPNA